MTRLESSDNIFVMATKLSGGNPGALRVCLELYSIDQKIDKDSALQGIDSCLLLDRYWIYDADIWMLYKDVCGEDIEKTIIVLKACQLGFIVPDLLKHAISHYGEGIILDTLIERVKDRLPNFGKELEEVHSDEVI